MSRRPCQPARLRALGSWAIAVALAFTATTAAAAGPPGGSAADAERAAQAAEWKGRYCTPTGCAGTSESPWGSAAGFGAVVLASGWIARRRPARND